MIPAEKILEDFFDSQKTKRNISHDKRNVEKAQEQELFDKSIIDFKSKGILPKKDLLLQICDYLAIKRREALHKREYDSAEECDILIEKFALIHRETLLETENSTKMNRLFDRWKSIQNEIKSVHQSIDHQILVAADELRKKKAMYEQQHKENVQKIEEKFSSPSFFIRFYKPSSELLLLRDKETNLASQHQYKNAKEVKLLGDEQEQRETKETKDQIIQMKNSEIQKSETNKIHQTEKAQEQYQQRVNFLEADRERQLQPLLSAMQQLKNKKLHATSNKIRKELSLNNQRTIAGQKH